MDWLATGLRVVAWIILTLAGVVLVLGVFRVIGDDVQWDEVAMSIAWAVAFGVAALGVFGFARVVERR